MPKRKDIQKVMVIGSGPIVIGQAAEFDYAGTQACRSLKEEGLEVVLINSNPATIMTDLSVADRVYIEPLTVAFAAYVLAKERPDGIVATLGGQVGLNLAMDLARSGILDDLGIEVLGTPLDAIEQAEDRELFKRLMLKTGHPIPPSRSVSTVEDGVAFAEEVGYPLILRPAYTLGGSGGGFAHSRDELLQRLPVALSQSPIGQVLVECSIAGWKEVEYEVLRDGRGNAVTVCNMENLDPVGVHTGDSIVVAPSQTLTDDEYHMLRTAALDIVGHLGVQGGCNVQFALSREGEYRVIEVNPRVSRSSALASKATGYPIARVAAKIAIGFTLPEIINPVTGNTTAAFEPALDYVVVKIPRWPFDKFRDADRHLGSQMKATGEVMAIDRTFPAALQKAVRSLEIKRDSLITDEEKNAGDEEVARWSVEPTDRRLFFLAEAMRRGESVASLFAKTQIDPWFLHGIESIVQAGAHIEAHPEVLGDVRQLAALKQLGFTDRELARLTHGDAALIRKRRLEAGIRPVYKVVDTCAGEFPAATPYFYSTYGEENEAEPLTGPKVLVLGSGPIRIGQGIEFDAASVYAVEALRRRGIRAIIMNSNPETVSTDFNASDRLFFEPVTLEDVLGVIDLERPDGVLVQFGGQTAINLAEGLVEAGVRLIGTDLDGLRAAEDRELFDRVLEQHGLSRPPGGTALTSGEAVAVAERIGYPVLVRPSYVLGGRAMEIVDNTDELLRYMERAEEFGPGRPLLIDRYMNGLELEVDAVSDGEHVVIPAIMEHVERAGVHSGDSVAVLPPLRVTPEIFRAVEETTITLAKALGIRGLLNVQFVAVKDRLYIIEANPRSSRTVPFLRKATGVPMVDLAIEAALGNSLGDEWPSGVLESPGYYAVKMPVFSFGKLTQVDAVLGPEMKSTGEVMGLDSDYGTALYKALIAGGFRLPAGGRILATIADADKDEAMPLLSELARLGYQLYATPGTRGRLAQIGVKAKPVEPIGGGSPNIVDLIRQGKVDLVLNTITHGDRRETEGFYLRRAAVERGILCFTSLDTAKAALDAIYSRSRRTLMVHALNDWLESTAARQGTRA